MVTLLLTTQVRLLAVILVVSPFSAWLQITATFCRKAELFSFLSNLVIFLIFCLTSKSPLYFLLESVSFNFFPKLLSHIASFI